MSTIYYKIKRPLYHFDIKIFLYHLNLMTLSYWMPFRDVINELLNKYTPSIPQDSIFFRCRKVSYNLESEILKAERIRQSLSQLDLSDGVYSNPSSISYYETSKRSPNKTTFTKLMDKFNLNKPKRSGFVLTESFERLELFQKMRDAAIKQNFSEISSLIDDETAYDPFELQFINACKCFLLINRATNDNQVINDLHSIICSYYPLDAKTFLRKPLLNETYIICGYLSFAFISGEYVLDTYNKLFESITNSRVAPKYNYSTYTTIASNYITCAGKNLSRDIIQDVTNKAITCSLLSGNGSILTGIFWSQVLAFHKRFPLDISLCHKAYIFSELYKEHDSQYFKDYYFQCTQLTNGN